MWGQRPHARTDQARGVPFQSRHSALGEVDATEGIKMSFFAKLKDRMFKSSSKLGDGLAAIVSEGDSADTIETASPIETGPAAAPGPVEPTGRAETASPAEAKAPAPVSPAPEPARPGMVGRLFGRDDTPRRVLDDDMLEELEELLIQSDMGVDTALRVAANMAEGRFGKRLSVDEIKGLLADEVARIMEPVARPLPVYPKRPQVVLVVPLQVLQWLRMTVVLVQRVRLSRLTTLVRVSPAR